MQDTVFEEPVRQITAEDAAQMDLRYYDSQIHKAAFVLPRFARKVNCRPCVRIVAFSASSLQALES